MLLERLSNRHDRSAPACIAAMLVVVLLFGGPLACLTTQVPPVGSGGAFSLERDEAEMWRQSREEEAKLRAEAPLYQDPILNDYLNAVAQKVIPEESRGQQTLKIRVSAIRDPSLNAFTFPTGSVYVHTGLMARMENEAQLAMVLGHEVAHATHRHALEFQRSARNKMIGFSIASLVASIAVANAAGHRAERGDWSGAYVVNQVGNILAGLGLQLAMIAAVNGFGRELEREADEVGMRSMAGAGYDPKQASRVFELLKDDHGDKSKMEVFFFGSHPRLDERIQSSRELASAGYSGVTAGVSDTREFQMRTRVLVRDDAALNLEAGRYGHAEAELQRVLALTPNDPVAHFLFGRLYEQQAGEAAGPAAQSDLTARAMARYEEAIRLDGNYADPHRAVGILRHKAGEKTKALAAFRRYLAISPDAPDAQQIKDYILELESN